MARRADYIIIISAKSKGEGATAIGDFSTILLLTLLGPRHLKFRNNVYQDHRQDYSCLEVFAFLPLGFPSQSQKSK